MVFFFNPNSLITHIKQIIKGMEHISGQHVHLSFFVATHIVFVVPEAGINMARLMEAHQQSQQAEEKREYVMHNQP